MRRGTWWQVVGPVPDGLSGVHEAPPGTSLDLELRKVPVGCTVVVPGGCAGPGYIVQRVRRRRRRKSYGGRGDCSGLG